jgi:hypothetical protein
MSDEIVENEWDSSMEGHDVRYEGRYGIVGDLHTT